MGVIDSELPDNSRATYLKIHVQGAILRSVGSLCMWLFALFAFWIDEIRISHFIGVTCSVLFLVLIGPPTLFILKRTTRDTTFTNLRHFFNMLDVVGYTAVIYSLGGFEAAYLSPMYAAFIAYLGVMAPPKEPFIIAGFCAFCFGTVVVLDGLGIIPSLKVDPHFNPSVMAQFIRVFAVIGLLFIVAYISSFWAGILKQGQARLRQQNKKLEKALADINTLNGLLPICANCKKIRDDKGYWNQKDLSCMPVKIRFARQRQPSQPDMHL